MALFLLSQMPEANLVPNKITYSAGMSACEKAGEWKKALILFTHLQNCAAPDVINFGAGISACARVAEWQMALGLLAYMPVVRVLPSETSYNASISAAGKGCEWKMALLLLSQMLAAGVVPSRISLSFVVSACELCDEHSTAWTISGCRSLQYVLHTSSLRLWAPHRYGLQRRVKRL